MRTYKIACALLLCTAIAAPVSARSRDHLMCYKAGADFGGTTANLDDAGDPNQPGAAHTFLVKKPKDYCVPTAIDDNERLDPAAHWVLYATKRAGGECQGDTSVACKSDDDCGIMGPCVAYTSKFDKKDLRNRSVRVRDTYAGLDMRLDFSKELGVLAPASFGGSAPAAGSNDFFKCYGVKSTKASCVGGSNDGEACKESVDCPSGTCTANPKFTAQIRTCDGGANGGGLCTDDADCGGGTCTSILDNSLDDVLAPATTQQYSKLKMVCQAASANGESVVNDGTAMVCYGTKQTTGDELVPTIVEATTVAASTTNYEFKKRDLFCGPACIGEESLPPVFSQYVLKASTLALGTSGQPGQGLDIDNNPLTCSPSPGCSGGIDNALANIAALANESLQEAVDNGSIHLLYEFSQFADGTQKASGYIGSLASPANCVDFNNAAETCNYEVNEFGLSLGDTCRQESLIAIPVVINGATTPPNATAIGDGGGYGTTFTLALALGGFNLNLQIQNLKISMNLVHDGSDITAGSGILAGGVPLSALRNTIASLEGACVGGADAGEACTSNSTCLSGDCVLANDQSPEELAGLLNSLIFADIDLDGVNNCQPGANNINNFQTCDEDANCPDPAGGCQPQDSISLALVFNMIDAEIVGVAD